MKTGGVIFTYRTSLKINCTQRSFSGALSCRSWICSKISLRRHIESVHEGKTYHCQHCEQKCANGGSLKRHIQSIYEGKTFQCQHCDQNYTERCSLKTHIQSVYKGTGLKVLKVAKEMMNL